MLKIVQYISGILIILITIIMAVSFIANTLFRQKVTGEVKELFTKDLKQVEIIEKKDIEGLPISVQKWLENSQVLGKGKNRTVRLKQQGHMRTKEGQPWMPFKAEQYITIDKPGFIWYVKVKAAPFIYLSGRDRYFDGRGNMLIKLQSLITVVNAKGKEMDQGTLVRFLGEMVWYPSAALSHYIEWEGIDENSARATMHYQGISASGVFEFNENGDVIKFTAPRYKEVDGSYELEDWSVSVGGHKDFDGIRVPSKGEVLWNLKTGDFSWFKFRIVEIEYNKPYLFQ